MCVCGARHDSSAVGLDHRWGGGGVDEDKEVGKANLTKKYLLPNFNVFN